MIRLTIIRMIIYFLIGALSGISMGIVGVGAGMLTIPLLIYTGLTLQESVGISLIMELANRVLQGHAGVCSRIFLCKFQQIDLGT